MLSVCKITVKSANDARNVANYLRGKAAGNEVEDYYTAGRAESKWLGQGAASLGLTGTVNEEDFVALLHGNDPATGLALVRNADQERCGGVDCVFSAPNGVSGLWSNAPAGARMKIEAAHDAAVQRAIEFMEQKCLQTSRGKGRATSEPAKAIVAVFKHGTSRAMDPQLHSHAFILNVAQRYDGTSGAVKRDEIYHWKMAAGATYRAELAARLQLDLKIGIERTADVFDVAGFDAKLSAVWSKRRQQILAALDNPKAHGVGAERAKQAAAYNTREAKAELSPDLLRQRWRAEALELGHTPESLLAHARTAARSQVKENMLSRDDIFSLLTEHESVFDERRIYQSVAVAAQGHLDADGIENYVQEMLKDRDLVRLVSRENHERVMWSTREMLAIENEVIESAARRSAEPAAFALSQVERAIERLESQKRIAFSAEQRAFLVALTASAGGIKVGIGEAGTGKSTIMSALKTACDEAGLNVVGCGPSARAAVELQTSAGIQSTTIHSFLNRVEGHTDERGVYHPPVQKLDNKSVIVVDEAGMVDSRLQGRILTEAEKARARVILIGDNKQLTAVAAGGLFGHLAKRLNAVELTEIRRQAEPEHKAAIKQVRRGEVAEALNYYESRQLLYLEDDRNAACARAVKQWSQHFDRARPLSTIMIASTNAQIAALNSKAREWMKQNHQLAKETDFHTTDKTGRGAGTIKISEGDRIIFRKNDRKLGVVNGDLATIVKIKVENAQTLYAAKLDRGAAGKDIVVRFSEEDYAQIKHAYALTTHATQGATVERAVVVVGESLASREQTYVQFSRAKMATDVVITRDEINEVISDIGVVQRLATAHECSDEPRDWREEIRQAIKSMSRAREKETTLDYAEPVSLETDHALECE